MTMVVLLCELVGWVNVIVAMTPVGATRILEITRERWLIRTGDPDAGLAFATLPIIMSCNVKRYDFVYNSIDS